MPRRTKVLVIAAMLLIGAIAVVAFRKTAKTEPESSIDVATTPAPRPELAAPAAEKPAPTSHLTGRIESPDGAGSGPTPRTDGAGISLAAPSIGANPHSAFPTQEERPAAVSGGASERIAYSETTRHKVIDGDTLSGLALRYLGSADRYREIYELNRDVLASPDLLPIGTEVKIPAVGRTAPATPGASARPMVPVAPRSRGRRPADAVTAP